MGRKLFISVLGTGFYEECCYVSDDFKSGNLRFIQEATLKLITKKRSWAKTDKVIILLTEKAKSSNWNKSIKYREISYTKEEVMYEGLEKRLFDLNLPIMIVSKNIPDGKNEQEMWDIFKSLFDEIEDGDELYFDLTHSFRYLPMLVLVFGNYVKFLKKAKVVHISYGNYEARNEKNEAPINDLLPISALQDWTFASANYLENGNVNKLVELCNDELKPILKETFGKDEKAANLKKFIKSLEDVIAERQTCRGISIVKSENLKTLKTSANLLPNTFIEPLNPVFNKIKESLKDFDENENVMNGFSAAKWCLDFGLYQQAATILQENIITLICIEENLNWVEEYERSIVSCAFKAYLYELIESEWKIPEKKDACDDSKIRNIAIIKKIFTNNTFISLSSSFRVMSDLRNDLNHSGMRNNPMSAKSLKVKLEDRLEKIMQIIAKN